MLIYATWRIKIIEHRKFSKGLEALSTIFMKNYRNEIALYVQCLDRLENPWKAVGAGTFRISRFPLPSHKLFSIRKREGASPGIVYDLERHLVLPKV
ncbi:hypothetical protein [Roseibium sp. RKSG952]|uniref:hypothetical protein n=1 Tax=Roseibium sp. RKSG952 TaxID=2529384 RepID=UPI0012BD1E51|nr:hypothetical protein [Roseibium sp. RKSG952]MTH96717.1 hypothetical protein [Roseibium sp. RKSG952]